MMSVFNFYEPEWIWIGLLILATLGGMMVSTYGVIARRQQWKIWKALDASRGGWLLVVGVLSIIASIVVTVYVVSWLAIPIVLLGALILNAILVNLFRSYSQITGSVLTVLATPMLATVVYAFSVALPPHYSSYAEEEILDVAGTSAERWITKHLKDDFSFRYDSVKFAYRGNEILTQTEIEPRSYPEVGIEAKYVQRVNELNAEMESLFKQSNNIGVRMFGKISNDDDANNFYDAGLVIWFDEYLRVIRAAPIFEDYFQYEKFMAAQQLREMYAQSPSDEEALSKEQTLEQRLTENQKHVESVDFVMGKYFETE